ncbi:NAD(P)/FAD-dependent oxidoreductase [Pararhodobacter sp.]|uniref:NAD(P)/FAD-dependent oxidoreductase n=1 Tax=Pararhodobacter sp. TaxID=2127056 RepID=UPI002AFF2278|nr:NAD(P)/FAD-dependent oxidoreductase [Pararhodobacter sp.]
MDEVDLVVIGAGVVGLAIARAAARRGAEVLVLEAHDAPGMETSSRNSEVIHAGMYYAPGSLKAQHCVAGRRMLYRYLAARDLPYRQTGKLIVATTPEEDAKLAAIAARAVANGLTGDEALVRLTAAEARALEPALACTSALLSPSTGILDSHAFMLSLQGDAERAGAMFSFGSRVTGFRPGPPHLLSGTSQGEPWTLAAARVIVAGGLHTAGLMRDAGLGDFVPPDYWLKGRYFTLTGRGPFQHLIYPVPAAGGLGVHVTLDIGGGTRFGPDTVPTNTLDYTVSPDLAPAFEHAIRRYWPGLPEGALEAGYAGIRPKLHAPKGQDADFVIAGPGARAGGSGAEALVVLHGIESPGLTACLSLAEASCDALMGAPAGEFDAGV